MKKFTIKVPYSEVTYGTVADNEGRGRGSH
jgi:hypothetical protein